jgi:hypothetical protein
LISNKKRIGASKLWSLLSAYSIVEITVLTPAISQDFGFTAIPIGGNYILILIVGQPENSRYYPYHSFALLFR